MKYRIDPLPTVERDFSHRPPAQPTFGRVIAGLAVLVGSFAWPVLILSLEAVK